MRRQEGQGGSAPALSSSPRAASPPLRRGMDCAMVGLAPVGRPGMRRCRPPPPAAMSGRARRPASRAGFDPGRGPGPSPCRAAARAARPSRAGAPRSGAQADFAATRAALHFGASGAPPPPRTHARHSLRTDRHGDPSPGRAAWADAPRSPLPCPPVRFGHGAPPPFPRRAPSGARTQEIIAFPVLMLPPAGARPVRAREVPPGVPPEFPTT